MIAMMIVPGLVNLRPHLGQVVALLAISDWHCGHLMPGDITAPRFGGD